LEWSSNLFHLRYFMSTKLLIFLIPCIYIFYILLDYILHHIPPQIYILLFHYHCLEFTWNKPWFFLSSLFSLKTLSYLKALMPYACSIIWCNLSLTIFCLYKFLSISTCFYLDCLCILLLNRYTLPISLLSSSNSFCCFKKVCSIFL
jgi:hypothetical protein